MIWSISFYPLVYYQPILHFLLQPSPIIFPLFQGSSYSLFLSLSLFPQNLLWFSFNLLIRKNKKDRKREAIYKKKKKKAMSSNNPSSSAEAHGSADSTTQPARNSKRPKCISLISLIFLYFGGLGFTSEIYCLYNSAAECRSCSLFLFAPWLLIS